MSRVAELAESTGSLDEALARWRETRVLYASAGLDDGVAMADEHIRRLDAI